MISLCRLLLLAGGAAGDCLGIDTVFDSDKHYSSAIAV